jgi:type IV secretory pathway VirB10-like protein
MINLLELTRRQVFILSGATVAVGIALMVWFGMAMASTNTDLSKAYEPAQAERVVVDEPEIVKPAQNEMAQETTQASPSKPQAPKTATNPKPQQSAPQATPAQPTQPAQPDPCNYEGCRPPVDVTTLNERICYLAIASQDIELRTACGKGLGIWATMNQAIAWLNLNGWQ